MQPIVIVGGGISGLSATYYLSKLAKFNKSIGKIILIESSNRFGGWVNTFENSNGVLHEYGPRSLRKGPISGDNTLELIGELNLTDNVISKSSNDLKIKNKLQRYVASSDELISLKLPPKNFKEFLFKQKPLNKAIFKYMIHEFKTPKLDLTKQSLDNLGSEKDIIEKNLNLLNEQQLEDISIYEFIKLRFGEDLASWLLDPLLRGISSGDARRLSIRSMFEDMFKSERTNDGVLRGLLSKKSDKPNDLRKFELNDKLKKFDSATIWSFKDGMKQLPNGLVKHLSNDENVELRSNNKLIKFDLESDNKLNLTIENEQNQSYQLKAEHVFFSLNADHLSKLMPKENKNLEILKSTLSTIKSASVATVNLEFNRKGILDKNPGFGFLLPSHINSSILGVVFDSSVFPELDKSNEITRLSVMAGGDWYDELCKADGSLDESNLIEKQNEVLSKYLNIKEDPSFIKINTLLNCIPQYRVGHYLKLKLIDNEINKKNLKLSLIGSSYSGISLNDCIYNSRLKVEQLFN